MSKVLIPLADGFEEIEAISIVDVLRRGGLNVVTAAISKKEVIGANSIKVVADTLFDDAQSVDFDAIVLAGGNLGYKNLAKSDKLLELLRKFDKEGKLIGAICAAPYVLAKAGVLKSSYTCYPSIELEIQKSGYTSGKNVVIDGNIITSRGPATAIEFALELLRKLKSDADAQNVRKGLLA
ncbi:MAG: DJ-1/PfpI family protein [Campylobacteraceae bacterium]|jgi:4-methyl-5(b-hydroxyethyl)-thiazole monophosphate biosynthesis|nr:DJ-1/PfpI family protein [Campylobacteraceae bacterium]